MPNNFRPISAADVTPAYVPVFTYAGGAVGEDAGLNGPAAQFSTANVVVDDRGVGDYAPRSQHAKLLAGQGEAQDITVPRGWIAPDKPASAPPVTPGAADPVVTSLAPASAPVAQLPALVIITGTGFTQWSQVFTGGMSLPEAKAVYVSPTQMKVPIWAAAPGTVSVAVKDHGVLSNTDVLFTVT